MKFIELLKQLQEEYVDNHIVRKNGTILLAPGEMPKCKHMLFPALEEKLIKEFLIDEYELEFPKEYLEFLKEFNGANLFHEIIKKSKFSFAYPYLVLFGLPRTQPFGRPFDMEEPFDIRIEDFDNRHKNVPSFYLKCGCYCVHGDSRSIDIFIDTKTGKVSSYYRDTDTIVSVWENIDECLYRLFEELSRNN